jgi:hypothetical protein
VCSPEGSNVCWQNVTNVDGQPFGWSAAIAALSPNGSVTTVQFV